MNISLKIAFILAALLVIYVVVKSIKKHSLHPSYAVLWIAVSLFLLSLAFLETMYAYIAKTVFGLYGGDHLIYISLISFLLIYCFYLTTRICQMADRISKLISFAAVTDSEVAELKKRSQSE